MGNNAGILIIALCHKIYYGYARNLVATIRAYAMDTPITVVTDNPGLTMEAWLNVNIMPVDNDLIFHNGQIQPFRLKLQLPKITPYKKTLYLDADMAWLYRSAKEFIQQLDGNAFAISNMGKVNTCTWANVNAIRQQYGDGEIYHLFSEVIYFEKSKEITKFFDLALKSYDNPKISTIPFAGAKASDEFALITAIMQNGIRPHEEHWNPVFWYFRDKKRMALHPQTLTTQFYGYSLGGNLLPEFVKKNYNIIVAAAFAKLGLQYPTVAQDKRRVIAERKNM